MKKFQLIFEAATRTAPFNRFMETLRTLAYSEQQDSDTFGPPDETWKMGFDHVIKEIYADNIEDARIMADNIILSAMPKFDMPYGITAKLQEIAMEVDCDLRATWLKHSAIAKYQVRNG